MEEYDVESILEMYEDDYVPESRPMMAGGGQLVKPSADGSRPGYASDFVNINDIKKYNKNLLDKSIVVSDVVKAGANQAERVTLQNIFDVVSRTKDGDELIKNFKKTPNAENFLKLKSRRKNRLGFEREQALPPEEKAELRKKQKIAEQKWRNSKKGLNYYNNYLSQSGIFPARTAEERVWRDIYRASKQKKGESRFILKYPKSANVDKVSGLPKTTTSKITGKEYIPWDRFYKDITFYDTVTKKNIKFNTVRNWMVNNIENGAKKYDNTIKNYKASNVINTFEVDGITLSKLAKDKQKGDFAKRITTAAAVNHRSGLDNFWDTEVTTASGNKMLNDKVQQNIAAYKNASNPNIEKKLLNIMKQNAKKIEGGGTVVLDDKTVIGKKPTIKSVASALEKELDVKIPIKNLMLELAGKVTDKCNIGNAEGGRIGFSSGRNYCLNVGKEALEKGLKTGFPKNQQVLAEGILKAGRSLKDIASIRGLLGPAALAFTAVTEAGFIGYDMLSSGKSFKEAIGGNLFNYLLGDKTKVDLDEELIKRLRNIPGAPSQGFREFTEKDIGKMQAFKSGLMEISDLNEQFGKLDTIQKNREALEMSPEDSAFNKGAFQLDKQEDLVRENIQDFYRSGGQQRLEGIDYGEGAKQLLRGNLLAKQDQLYDAGIGKFYQSPKGDERRTKELIDTRYQLDKLQNPTQYDEFGEYFMSRPPSEQSYLMGLGYSGGGIATLQNKKKTNTQKLASVYKNPGFKYWAVPPKKGPASKGLKVPPKQVKKV